MPVTPKENKLKFKQAPITYFREKNSKYDFKMLKIVYGLSKSTVTLKLEKSLRLKTK